MNIYTHFLCVCVKIKSVTGRHILISMFIATTLKIARIESNHECPLADERFKKRKSSEIYITLERTKTLQRRETYLV